METKMGKIAVVGMGGVFPGAEDMKTFARNIMNRKTCVIDVPEDRWLISPDKVVASEYLPDTACSDRAGLITDFHFDPWGFRIASEYLSRMDPLHQMVLHGAREAMSHCFCNPEIRRKTGVVLAAISLPTEKTSDIAWRILMEKNPSPLTGEDVLSAGIVGVPAALLARAMGFSGGAYTLDAACASSLYAIKIACDQLNSGKTDMMLAGGVSRPDALYTQIGFTQLKALSPSGRCAPFDRHADGLVVGEGAGIVVLKRLEDAICCGDTISGVITGAGWSNDIGGNLVAPASDGQKRAMAAAYKNAGWTPGDVQLVECHGSATPVGDNIELNSMKNLWEDAGAGGKPCAIGSVKSMTGHLLTAAGATGFIKTLIGMEEKILPPSLNFSEPTPDSPLYTTGFHVQTAPESWPSRPLGQDSSTKARRAGISAFGFGGINAHILVESFSPHRRKTVYSNSPEHNKNIKAQPVSAGKALQSDSALDQNTGHLDEMDIAVIGMEIITPKTSHLESFRHLIFNDDALYKEASDFRETDRTQEPDKCIPKATPSTKGLFFREIETFPGEFHIPPNQIPDLLPQHLIMLKASAGALRDAGLSIRPRKTEPAREKFGAAIGIAFDYGATDFHLRWRKKRNNTAHTPSASQGVDATDTPSPPPLTANRTLGALGGIAASRIAREFKLGGPCFTVSSGADSGIKAIDIGIQSLKNGETDLFLCGCVDMAGDVRQHTLNEMLQQSVTFTPSEGAAAILLKPVNKAQRDGDRIYAVIKGTGSGAAGKMVMEKISLNIDPSNNGNPLVSSLENALKNLCITPDSIGLYLGNGIGNAAEDTRELQAVLANFEAKHPAPSIPIGSVAGTVGHTYGVSALVSIIAASLSLFHRTIPALPAFSSLRHGASADELSEARNSSRSAVKSAFERSAAEISFSELWENYFHIPLSSTPWIKNNSSGNKRIACVGALTPHGTCAHAILQEFVPASGYTAKNRQTSSDATVENLPKSGMDSIISLPAHPFNSVNTDCINRLRLVDHITDENEISFRKEEGETENFNDDAIARTHMKFLDFSNRNMKAFEKQFTLLTTMADIFVNGGPEYSQASVQAPFIEYPEEVTAAEYPHETYHLWTDRDEDRENAENTREIEKTLEENSFPPPLFDRQMCMEFATGSAGAVLGETFNIIDSYPVRVRLPGEPLMLVDRIMNIEGEMLSMGPGKIITQHDVKPGAWYLDGGKTPVSISIEAGQADLFLCSYLGIDHAVKGERRYRLLDARVTFHRTLPEPNETIEYTIEIDRFLKQGAVYLFFFHYKGYIKNELLISMRDGCAGFFTPEEVENSGGIILKKEDTRPEPSQTRFHPFVPLKNETYTEKQVEALRQGNLADCFGPEFNGIILGTRLRLPGGRMHLIDRVTRLEPRGGRFGLGSIKAEADIRPDAWFLTCHFIDDMVMPGTLMYECCAHTLRIFTQRMGWISERDDVHYDIIPGIESDLKCRGPVTVDTKKAVYEIEIKEIYYEPAPCIIADAHMFSDDHRIVLYKNMGMRLAGITQSEIELFWNQRLL